MWEKRKLTRKSLDELAKIMPVLSEEEQRVCIGRDRYYTFNGKILGVVGPGNDMKMIDEHLFDIYQGSGEWFLNSYATNYSDTQSSSKESVMKVIASGMGISVTFFSGPSDLGGKWNHANGVQLNTNTKWFQPGCYNELKLILYHEQFHQSQGIPEKISEKTQAEYEVKAYEATMSHPSFCQTSSAFQSGIRASYEKQKQIAAGK